MREINNKKRKRTSKRKPLPVALAVIYLIMAAAFSAMLIWLNMLPLAYLLTALTLVVLVSLLIIAWLLGKRVTAGHRIAGLILSVVFIVIFCVGTVYIYSTQDLVSKITTIGKSTEEYYVVVRDSDKKREKIDDIAGDVVYMPDVDTKSSEEASTMLKDKVDVSFKKTGNALKMDNKLKKKDYDVLLLSNSYYEMLIEDNVKFEDQSKVIYKLTVEQEVENFAKSVDKIANTPFNIYISGIDTFGKIAEVSRSDVNMLVTVNPVSKTVLMTNIPRDSYVTLHSYQASDKLTHAGVYGIEESVTTIEDMMNTEINYYLRVNF